MRHNVSGWACASLCGTGLSEWLSLAWVAHQAKQTGCAALKQAGRNITQPPDWEKGRFRRTGEMHKLQAFRAQFTKLGREKGVHARALANPKSEAGMRIFSSGSRIAVRLARGFVLDQIFSPPGKGKRSSGVGPLRLQR
jgi:hypothetical protein